MNDGITKSRVRQLLQGMGFEVEDIPKRQDRRTPDFEVIGDRNRFIVELKEKGDDPDLVKRKQELLASGQIVTKVLPVGHRNRLDTIIENGVEQMALHHCLQVSPSLRVW